MAYLKNELQNMLHNKRIWLSFFVLLLLNVFAYIVYINADSIDYTVYRDMCNQIKSGASDVTDILMENGESAEAQNIFSEYMAVNGYDSYLEKVKEESDENMDAVIFQSKFSLSNLTRTKSDYSKLEGLKPVFSGTHGMCRCLSYSGGVLIVIAFIVIVSIETVMRDKKNGLLNLYKTTEKGDRRLVVYKFLAASVFVAFAAACVYLLNLLITEGIYGTIDKKLPVQSLLDYLGFGYRLNIYEFLILDFCCKLIGLLAILFIVLSVSMASSSETMVFVKCTVLFLAVMTIAKAGELAGNECMYRLFSGTILDTPEFFGYLNYNIFNHAVNAGLVDILIYLSAILALLFFSCIYFERKEMYYRGFKLFRKKKSKAYRIHGIGSLESRKLWFGYRMIYLLLLFIFVTGFMYFEKSVHWGISEYSYKFYIKQIEGDITEDKIEYLSDEELNFQALEEEADEIEQLFNDGKISEKQYDEKITPIADQLTRLNGFLMCKNYAEYVIDEMDSPMLSEDNEPSLGFVYERGIKMLIGKQSMQTRLLQASIFLAFIFIILTFLYLEDYRDKIHEIIVITGNYKKLGRIKCTKAVMIFAFAYILLYGSEFIWIYQNVGMTGLNYSIYSITNMGDSLFNVSILHYIILVNLLRIAGFAALSSCYVIAGKKIKNSFYMLGGALLFIVLPLVFMYMLGL